jgi:hypothetical protein
VEQELLAQEEQPLAMEDPPIGSLPSRTGAATSETTRSAFVWPAGHVAGSVERLIGRSCSNVVLQDRQ